MLNYSLFFIVAVLCVSYAQAKYEIVQPRESREESECPHNEVIKKNYHDVDTLCDRFTHDDKILRVWLTSRCRCRPNLVRHSDGSCVPVAQCHINEVCPELEELNVHNILEPTCDAPNEKTRKRQSRCVCQEGYFRHYDGWCTNDRDDCEYRHPWIGGVFGGVPVD